ncbi:acetate kinase [Fusarium subglutinans]|uniref:Probable acetate kinase n=1 Tax=Gibberella subglutinans TaxID=42677 RepID=A0A8H5P1M9_GIBSU|nr:acetate kinase [Fusarium subglutinans]KAF5586612.1 acetate kinase [Fusarium subglutinans]
MSSSGSSFTSSSLGRPPTYGRTYVSPVDSTWTPTSGISTISAPTTEGSGTGTSVLDLGPPGFQATMCDSPDPLRILFQDTPDERVVYLGPWEVVGSEQRRVLWQGSYQNELLEHFLPSDTPSDIYPHTLHSRHRPYYDPSDMERYLTFQEPHRIRYTTDEGVCIHDQYVTIRYEFTTVESSIQFQGDLRRKDLVDFYDVDVVWTNVHGRTDGFGKVKGIGAIQRLKLWRDRYTTFHSLSVCANKTDGQYREYDIHSFDGELRGRDDRAKQLRLNASGRRHTSGDDQHSHRRFSLPHRMRSRTRTNDSSEPRSLQQPTLDIRYLAIQFTERQGQVRVRCHISIFDQLHHRDEPHARAAHPSLTTAATAPPFLIHTQHQNIDPFKVAPSVMKVILAINAGSSSVKISVYTADKNAEPYQIAEASIGGLTAPPATLAYTRRGEKVVKAKEVAESVKNQEDAFDLLLKTFIDDDQLKEISSKEDIAIASHRIVHGGDYDRSQVITQDAYHHLEELSDLAPLHNGVALSIVDTCISALPKTINVACFDSQFHTTIPPHIYTYPIDPKIAKSNRLRKYGFHGISYAFITRAVAQYLEKDVDSLNMIALHLGSGASACAIKGGKSWDTSMGLTPLAGLPGATRSGSVDPSPGPKAQNHAPPDAAECYSHQIIHEIRNRGVGSGLVFHYASDVGKLSPASTKHLHISRAEEILNKESGWKSMTGTTNFGVVAESDEPTHRLAFEIFVDRIAGFVGSYFVTLEGRVDALVFAGGIGEHSAKLRSAVVERVACLGFALDDVSNQEPIKDVVQELGKRDARQRVLVCQTDEQLEMARLCAEKEDIW